jgi:signal transduction histidine kinase/ligand-binding sensor domain-containing protein/CheY-like chemotaxis protein/AraC-like DNA-binding protein
MKHIYFYITIYLIAQPSLLGQRILFNSITPENGLSGSTVNCLLQDNTGFIWIGTDDGLNRFDGNEFKVFKHIPYSNNSISDNSIWALCEDTDKNIWIGTKQGLLNKFNTSTEIFEQINLGTKTSSEIGITSIIQDKSGVLWIGTYSQGLFRYDPVLGKVRNWTDGTNSINEISNKYITSLLQDDDGYIWISTYYGLNRFDPKNLEKGFTKFFTSETDLNTICNNLVWRVNRSTFDENRLWIGTAGGICSYDIKTGKINRFDVKSDYQLQFNKSFAIVVEQQMENEKILWAATYGGLYKINLSTNKSEQFIYDKKNSNGLLSNQIDQLLVDRSGVLWIATDKGLNYHTLKTQRFNRILTNSVWDPTLTELYNSDIKAVLPLTENNIYLASVEGLYNLNISQGRLITKKLSVLNNINLWSLEKGSDNTIWIGTYGNGLINYNPLTDKTKYFRLEIPNLKTLAFNYIKSVLQSKSGKLWLGFWGGGLAEFDTKTESYRIFRYNENDPGSISYNDVWDLHEDKYGRIWVGTYGGGLNLFIPDTEGKFKSFKYENDNKNSLSSNSIISITEITADNFNQTVLLICTENGLNRVTVKNKNSDIYDVELKFEHFENETTELSNSIKGILLDDENNYWISTNNGLLKYDPKNKTVVNFNRSNGFNSNTFNTNSCAKTSNGIIIFGNTNGPVIFNPKEINLSSFDPKVVLTDFLIFNQSILPGNDSPLQSSITYTKELSLSYQQNVFTFKFASLDYNSPEQINFMYKLEGFDRDWVSSGNRHNVTYIQLNSGTYYFKVKGTNSDGQWSDNEKSIKIIINAPWWGTGWAYLFYVSIVLLGLFTIRKFELNRSKLRNELKLLELESKKSREIENIKSRFFANLSHEFRTPLMLIKGPIEQLLKDKALDKKENYEVIHRNSVKLQTLIDQLLELSQLESSSIPLNAKYEKFIPILRGLFYSFASLADQKNITLKFTSSSEELFLWIDRDKFEKIINNILSNAFKFTPQGGNISIDVKNILLLDKDYAEIIISDSGIGIPQNKIDKIFDRFYQVDDSAKRSFGGSGIGLALVRELVDLHKWRIKVESEIGKGTQFILHLPMDDYLLLENEKLKTEVSNFNDSVLRYPTWKSTGSVFAKQNITIVKPDLETTKESSIKSSVLIVEDSEDVRNYMNELLKEDYKIAIAEDGRKGLKTALEILPDLIITDIMMPEIDGLEFCRRIKSDWKTSHIPVILLTAKASGESKIEGLETGADDYITKPFSYSELSIRIKNLLEQRKRLREKFSRDLSFKPENITPNKADQDFLQNAISIVNKNISDPMFDSEKFSEQIFLSRSQLHRKIQTISGQSTGEFIRTIRLKKAAGLILEKQFSITQIAFEVGFNSPSHFTKAFKQMFDCLPSEYLDRNNS